MLSARADHVGKLKNDKTKKPYDCWRYTFPAEDTTHVWAKAPSQEFSDMQAHAFKKDMRYTFKNDKKPVPTSDQYGLEW